MCTTGDALMTKSCMVYFKCAYQRWKNTGQDRVCITPLHTELALGNYDAVSEILRLCNKQEIVQFALNTPV